MKSLDYLQLLETEAIHVMREAAASFERPAMLFPGGKYCNCLLRIAEKAFRPADLPMPLLNIDTGRNSFEHNQFPDARAKEAGAKLIVRTVADAVKKGIAFPTLGESNWNRLQVPTLLAAVEEFRFDCLISATTREEKCRGRERFFSFRDCYGQWHPKTQRLEIWNLYNTQIDPGENMRVFPLSNWTEMDVSEYIQREKLWGYSNN